MDGIELMASAMHAAQARLDVAAGNLSNVASDGFRRRLATATLGDRGIAVATRLDPTRGPLERTGRAFDLALTGPGALTVENPDGTREAIRSGSFVRDPHGHLADARGRILLGACGPLVVSPDATISQSGLVLDRDRAIECLPLPRGGAVQSGFLERSNVDAVGEMIEIVVAQRAFETSQKTLSAIDDVRAKSTSDVARVKS